MFLSRHQVAEARRLGSERGRLTTLQFKVKLPAESFHSYKCEAPDLEVEVSKDMLIDMYTKMVRTPPPIFPCLTLHGP